MCLRWIRTVEEYHSAVAREEMINRTELNVGEWFGMEPFSSLRGVVYVVRGNNGILPLSRALLGPYHCSYLNRFCRDDLLKQGSVQSDG